MNSYLTIIQASFVCNGVGVHRGICWLRKKRVSWELSTSYSIDKDLEERTLLRNLQAPFWYGIQLDRSINSCRFASFKMRIEIECRIRRLRRFHANTPPSIAILKNELCWANYRLHLDMTQAVNAMILRPDFARWNSHRGWRLSWRPPRAQQSGVGAGGSSRAQVNLIFLFFYFLFFFGSVFIYDFPVFLFFFFIFSLFFLLSPKWILWFVSDFPVCGDIIIIIVIIIRWKVEEEKMCRISTVRIVKKVI